MFASVFRDGTVEAVGFFIVLTVSLVSGIVFSLLSCYRSQSSKSFGIATALIPMTVAVIIALVNGNIGIGVAVAGAFGLVRFRSAPGTAREIAVIFIAMAAGLAFGMGYLAYGVVLLFVCGGLLLLYELRFSDKNAAREKLLKITIPEALDYTSVFDDIFGIYTSEARLEKVKSVNMGSMFRLTYRVKLKSPAEEKAMLDAVRTRNGNLEVMCSRADLADGEL